MEEHYECHDCDHIFNVAELQKPHPWDSGTCPKCGSDRIYYYHEVDNAKNE